MRTLPPHLDYRDPYVPVFVRTDHSDDAAWQDVIEKLNALPTGWDSDFWNPADMPKFLLQTLEWEGASPDDVLSVLAEEAALSVVFIADRVTMTDQERPLLAVTTAAPWAEYYPETTEYGREFRIVPRESHGLHLNLELATMDFPDWSKSAAHTPDGVFRRF
ncbi:DUF6924 domain-containing protein [Actinoplanes sp. NPDC049265]|uniref:DUF6924 domain-containing protein n=1 Tax=Actinoplanes sp. NPDC049265 TaxID=3363902 RepID=UPI003721A7E5